MGQCIFQIDITVYRYCITYTHVAQAVLQVTISSNPVTETGVYLAGSSLILTCQANGMYLPLTYRWNSTCEGDCFALEETTPSVQDSALHSGDGGVHTCSVTDYVGHQGMATFQMTVSGDKISLHNIFILHCNFYYTSNYMVCRCCTLSSRLWTSSEQQYYSCFSHWQV